MSTLVDVNQSGGGGGRCFCLPGEHEPQTGPILETDVPMACFIWRHVTGMSCFKATRIVLYV